jgi:hypothetical protein
MTNPITPHSLAGCAYTSLAVGMAVLATACDVRPERELGETDRAFTSAPDAGRDALRPERINDFSGTWIGSAEDLLGVSSEGTPSAYVFPSGSSQIRLQLTGRDDAGETPSVSIGSLTFGDGTPPPPATDRALGYPVDPEFRFPGGVGDPSAVPPTEGFAYSIEFSGANSTDLELWKAEHPGLDDSDLFNGGYVIDGILDVEWDTDEVYASWCALQTAADCAFPQGIGYDDAGLECTIGDTGEPIDCSKAELCLQQRCRSLFDDVLPREARLRLHMTDSGLVGVFVDAPFVNARGYRTQLGTVRFVRASAVTP